MSSTAITNKNQSADSLCLSRDHWGRLVFIPSGEPPISNILLTPLFPISDPGRWIAVITSDGRELACIEEPADHPIELQTLIREELSFRDFVPRISAVLYVSGNSEPCEWHVRTNHGETKFVLKSEDDIRRLSPFEVMIIDANGGRYRIDDTRLLDRKSRRHIEWYV